MRLDNRTLEQARELIITPSTHIKRERRTLGGRTQEIQRLIGRSLRPVVALNALWRANHLNHLQCHPGGC